MQSVGMLENYEADKAAQEPEEEFNVDDMLITRGQQTSAKNMNLFGLACVFGAIGMVSVITDNSSEMP